jgi:hypothetical protein
MVYESRITPSFEIKHNKFFTLFDAQQNAIQILLTYSISIGGFQLYQHHIKVNKSNFEIEFSDLTVSNR